MAPADAQDNPWQAGLGEQRGLLLAGCASDGKGVLLDVDRDGTASPPTRCKGRKL
ncbi:MAG TPA: hypothetical protein VHF25_03235 [Nitriliruptorales bacterium]|nr:hypothetical protein [Nitriliruptorales bacterium]